MGKFTLVSTFTRLIREPPQAKLDSRSMSTWVCFYRLLCFVISNILAEKLIQPNAKQCGKRTTGQDSVSSKKIFFQLKIRQVDIFK